MYRSEKIHPNRSSPYGNSDQSEAPGLLRLTRAAAGSETHEHTLLLPFVRQFKGAQGASNYHTNPRRFLEGLGDYTSLTVQTNETGLTTGRERRLMPHD